MMAKYIFEVTSDAIDMEGQAMWSCNLRRPYCPPLYMAVKLITILTKKQAKDAVLTVCSQTFVTK